MDHALYFYYYHSSSISARGRFVPTGCSHSAPTSQPPVFPGRRREGHPRAGEEDRDVVTGSADGSVQVAGSNDRVCGSRGDEAGVD